MSSHKDVPAPRALDPISSLGAPTAPHRRGNTIIVVIPLLVFVITFLFWYLTWFGRRLSDGDMEQYLTDTSVPHKTQHALSQLADRMARGDTSARRWYPQILQLATNKEPGLRLMSAWVMGQDNQSPEFHQILTRLLEDGEPAVRWNAALGLARFGDPAGAPQLRLMLRPYTLRAARAGRLSFKLKEKDTVGAGTLIARITPADGSAAAEVRSPLAGQVERRLTAEGATVAVGDQITTLVPGFEQVWEALRALYLVGRPDDLEDVEHFARGVAGMPENLRQQAALTAQAINHRTNGK